MRRAYLNLTLNRHQFEGINFCSEYFLNQMLLNYKKIHNILKYFMRVADFKSVNIMSLKLNISYKYKSKI